MRGLFDQVEIFLRLYVGGASVFMWSMRSFSALCRLGYGLVWPKTDNLMICNVHKERLNVEMMCLEFAGCSDTQRRGSFI